MSKILFCIVSFNLFSSQSDFMTSSFFCISSILLFSMLRSLITVPRLLRASVNAWSLSKSDLNTVVGRSLSVSTTRGLCGALVIVGAEEDCKTGGVFDEWRGLLFPGKEDCEVRGNATRLFKNLLVDPTELDWLDNAHCGGSFHPGSCDNGKDFWLETVSLDGVCSMSPRL